MKQSKEITYVEAIKVQKWLLHVIGAWPNENSTKFFKVRKAFSWLIHVLFGAILVNAVIENVDNFGRISQVAYVLGALICTSLKTLVLHTRQGTFWKCIPE